LAAMGRLSEIQGTRWQGSAELWLDPLGNEVQCSDCTLSIDGDVVSYTWSYKGEGHEGSIALTREGAEFRDSWHQPQPMSCHALPDAWGLFQLEGVYGPDSDWGWRTGLSLREPSGELVLQMTNVAPWGEEARAVRMTCTRLP
jgi:hypothetical protein